MNDKDPSVEPSASETAPSETSDDGPRVGGKPADKKRTRSTRTFPASSFLEALPLAEAIHEHASGQRVRRLTLFEKMQRSAESSAGRQLVTDSGQYKLTSGGYRADYLELTPTGSLASDKEAAERPRLAARLDLAIAKVEPFNALYEQFKDNRLPSPQVMRDALLDKGMPEDIVDEAVDTFLANARDLGLIRNMAGAERLLTFEHLLDETPENSTGFAAAADTQAPASEGRDRRAASSPALIVAQATGLDDVCFVVSPIGEDGSEHRKHADLILGSLIEPALASLKLRPIRADKISKPGMITSQVIDHIVRAPLVIADLSFGNANVFYELALRHAKRSPAVQLIRAGDHLPFDVGQYRTVSIDMTDIYSLVPQLDSYRAEITRQCRAALEGEGPADSPLSLFYPDFWA